MVNEKRVPPEVVAQKEKEQEFQKKAKIKAKIKFLEQQTKNLKSSLDAIEKAGAGAKGDEAGGGAGVKTFNDSVIKLLTERLIMAVLCFFLGFLQFISIYINRYYIFTISIIFSAIIFYSEDF